MAELTPELWRAAIDFLNEMTEVIGSVGRHAGHELQGVGRCVYCSCGYRFQGRLPSVKERAECAADYAERSSDG